MTTAPEENRRAPRGDPTARASAPVDALRLLVAEAVGTALLLAVVIGSGAASYRTSGDIDALVLLPHALAVGAAVFALTAAFGASVGAHLNPGLTLAEALVGRISAVMAAARIVAQAFGAVGGAVAANAAHGFPLIATSYNPSPPLREALAGEAIAAFGVVAVWLGLRLGASGAWSAAARVGAAAALGAMTLAAMFATTSGGYANAAITLGRSLSRSWAGLRWEDAGSVLGVQLVVAAMAAVVLGWLNERPRV